MLCRPSSAPCPPSQLSVSVNCSTNSAVLHWNSSPNAVSYTGKAVCRDGHNVTCDAGAGLSCRLDSLQCGKEYSFTVSSSDGHCQSPDSEPVIRTTGEEKRHLCFLFILSLTVLSPPPPVFTLCLNLLQDLTTHLFPPPQMMFWQMSLKKRAFIIKFISLCTLILQSSLISLLSFCFLLPSCGQKSKSVTAVMTNSTTSVHFIQN